MLFLIFLYQCSLCPLVPSLPPIPFWTPSWTDKLSSRHTLPVPLFTPTSFSTSACRALGFSWDSLKVSVLTFWAPEPTVQSPIVCRWLGHLYLVRSLKACSHCPGLAYHHHQPCSQLLQEKYFLRGHNFFFCNIYKVGKEPCIADGISLFVNKSS